MGAHVFWAKAEGCAHIPFRNSKLTHLMEPCLSGSGKTLMFVNVNGDRNDTSETLCSLRFAKIVSQCNTGGKARRSFKVVQHTPRAFSKPVVPKVSSRLTEGHRRRSV